VKKHFRGQKKNIFLRFFSSNEVAFFCSTASCPPVNAACMRRPDHDTRTHVSKGIRVFFPKIPAVHRTDPCRHSVLCFDLSSLYTHGPTFRMGCSIHTKAKNPKIQKSKNPKIQKSVIFLRNFRKDFATYFRRKFLEKSARWPAAFCAPNRRKVGQGVGARDAPKTRRNRRNGPDVVRARFAGKDGGNAKRENGARDRARTRRAIRCKPSYNTDLHEGYSNEQ